MPEPLRREEILKKLLKQNNEYKRLHKSHQLLEEKLHSINRVKRPTDRDEAERKRIQKLKLQRKDQMEKIVRKNLDA